MLPIKFRSIWPSEFRGDDFFQKLTNEKHELPVAAMFIKQIRTKSAIFMDNLPTMLPTMSRFIWQSGFRVEDFLEINQSETRIAFGGHVCQRIGTK